MRQLSLLCSFSFFIASTFAASALAETSDFGGHSERFKGGGDRTPPRCQIDLPRAATSPFYIKWHCTDDVSPEDEIRSELWMMRKGGGAAEKLASFIGFPAAVLIDELVLRDNDIANALPVSFRLVAIDRAGISVITPYLPVLGQDNSVDTCDLLIETEATEANGGTIGQPALTVSLTKVNVLSRQSSQNDLIITTTEKNTAAPCELEKLCADDDELTFRSTLSIGEDDAIILSEEPSATESSVRNGRRSISGSLSVSPGDVLVSLDGEGEVSSGNLERFEASGNTVLDDAPATITLTCSGS